MQNGFPGLLQVLRPFIMGKQLTDLEMQELIDQLFACENPNYSPSGNVNCKDY